MDGQVGTIVAAVQLADDPRIFLAALRIGRGLIIVPLFDGAEAAGNDGPLSQDHGAIGLQGQFLLQGLVVGFIKRLAGFP